VDFAFSQEQEMLRDGARRFLADDFAARRDTGRASEGNRWRDYADFGWLAVLVPEDAGGLGCDIEEALILAEEMGRALSMQPYTTSAICAIRLIDRVASGQNRLKLLSDMASGTVRLAPAIYEPSRRYALKPETHASSSDTCYRLTGDKSLIEGGATADALFVTAVLDDDTIGLFLVAHDKAFTLRQYKTIDDRDTIDVHFDQVSLSPEALIGITTVEVLDEVIDTARLALCADALGALERAIEMTTEYLKTRTQFGQPLASFQALQHSVVEMHIEADLMRSSLYHAVATFQQGTHFARRKAVSSCCVKTFDAAKEIAGMAVHLHGGIGMTTEYPVGHFLRRVMVSERSFGNVEHHLARYMEAQS
jgi:acyl-CoA dehydrogenase